MILNSTKGTFSILLISCVIFSPLSGREWINFLKNENKGFKLDK